MADIKAIVLRAAGINCDMETEYALELAGAKAERVHINRIIEDKGMLDDYQIIVFPGGFSYGDDVAAGKILANQVMHHLSDSVRRFIDDGKLVLGICNGFQVLVKAGILPGEGKKLAPPRGQATGTSPRDRKDTEKERPAKSDGQSVTITYNDSGKFEDRWVYLAAQSEKAPGAKCVFIDSGRQIYLPVAHAEGKVVIRDEATLDELKSEGRVAFKYVDENGEEGGYPINPNGSTESIAGLTDATGRILGLMPHPERFVRATQHPRWTRREKGAKADGMTIFDNAVKYVRENL